MTKRFLFLLTLLGSMARLQAQTNFTSYITNPSFEQGTEGWVQKSMSTQGNSVFDIKAGNTYMEKWTGRGGAVGSGLLSQEIQGLPPGNYELTVASQNIQEDTPTAAQTGAWIFAGEQKTTVTVRGQYTVAFTHVSGTITIGFEAEDASGNWIACDNFRLVQKDDARDEVRAYLQGLIAAARQLYADGPGAEAFDAALKEAEAVAGDSEATSQAMAAQAEAVRRAEEAFRLANASEDAPFEMTSRIVNPSFENGWDGWTQSGMQTQSNTSFSIKDGSIYAERWTERGGAVGDGSIRQTITGLPAGRYRLTVAAQNIQEDSPNTRQTGAWIVGEHQRTAVGVRGDYSVVFTVVTGEAVIGFEASGAKGNWIACDNFRLYYLGSDTDLLLSELEQRISDAEALTSKKMNAAVLQQLTAAIAAARQYTADAALSEVALALERAAQAAQASIDAYAALQQAITAAEKACAGGQGNERAAFQAVIGAAQALYDSPDSQNDAMARQLTALEQATFAYRVANGTGTVPRVTTDKRYARGAIEAFGRMSVSGVAASQIMEKGFCWSTEPDPTVLDNRTSNYLECNGEIYRMAMEPATVYYIRAYAMTKSYAVGYGDVIKLSTLPLGRVTYTYNFGGDEAQNNRITAALDEATYYWTNYTSIRGFNVSCVYSPGTPTADCGYGGNMRMGSNMGQRCGTCMHEMNHGIGGGTTEIWGGWVESPLRTSMNGDWAGERTNTVLNFWENRDDLIVTAAYDNAHWGFRTSLGTYSDNNTWLNKYAFNGAHLEPYAWAGPQDWNGTQIVFIGNALINQAMCEDGLVPVNYYSGGFCLPAYEFEQDDLRKYYIKSESEDHGLYDSYLIEATGSKVKWVSVPAGTVTQNDSAAWYITFDPQTQYYIFRNAATNHCLTYSNGFKTTTRVTPVAADKFHLMRGRHDVTVGDVSTRGYWIIHPENSNTPATLTASTKGAVTMASLDLFDRAAQQRWLFLDAAEVDAFEAGSTSSFRNDLADYIRQIRQLQQTPHREDVDGADAVLTTSLDAVEASAASAATVTQVRALLTEAQTAGIDFLSSVTPTDVEQPFDLTFMVANAGIDTNEGWTDMGAISNSCCEYFQRTFDLTQTVTGLPKGNFKLMAQAFQRPGSYTEAYDNYTNGKNEVNAVLYAGNKTKKICHIAAGAQTRKVHVDDQKVGSPARYVPNTMASAAAYFKKKLYDNEVWAVTSRKNASLKIGLRGMVTKEGYWTICDNFRLYYYGTLTQTDVTPVADLEEATPAAATTAPVGVYTINGILIRRGTNDVSGLPAGLYIAGGRKVFVR